MNSAKTSVVAVAAYAVPADSSAINVNVINRPIVTAVAAVADITAMMPDDADEANGGIAATPGVATAARVVAGAS